MNDITNNDSSNDLPDELTLLKKRADQLGIKYHPNIGLDKLKEKVNLLLSTDEPAEKIQESITSNSVPKNTKVTMRIGNNYVETKAERRNRLVKEASRLVRIRVSNMNPNKKEWEGEMYTVSNSTVGTFKKFVPFDNDEGWHVPKIIVDHMKERKCQVFYTAKNSRGAKIRKGKLINELAIEVLPDLTSIELEELARQQALRNSID